MAILKKTTESTPMHAALTHALYMVLGSTQQAGLCIMHHTKTESRQPVHAAFTHALCVVLGEHATNFSRPSLSAVGDGHMP